MKKISFVLVLSILLCAICSCSESAPYSAPQNSLDTQGLYVDSFLGADTLSPDDAVMLDPREDKVSFLAVGDNIVYNGQLREAKANAQDDPEADYDFSSMYENVADIIASYDLSFINQETVMAGESFGYSQYPSFNSPGELCDDLLDVGFDIVNIATNHMLDMGDAGLANTIDLFKSKNVLMVGGYDNEEDFFSVRTVEKNGIKIAVVGFTYGTNGKKPSADTFIPYIYKDSKNLIEDEKITEWIKRAESAADVVIVSMHWGNEYNQTPNSEQRRLAQLISDAGADVILGHHTHCVQPIEWIEGSGGNKTLCFYSLGNFTSETDETVSLVGGIACFDIILNERDGLRIENVTFTPTVMDYRNSFNKNTVYLLKDYTENLCKSHNIVTYFKQELDMKKLHGYVEKAIDKKYLPQSYLDSIN